jgi:pimeloyl-ACP methyl ester carboxylesterase
METSRNDVRMELSRGSSRRALLRAGAGLGALYAGVGGVTTALLPGGGARADSGQADPLTPVRLPAQAPAREGIADLGDARLWFWDTGGGGEPVVLLHPASGSALIWGYQQPAFATAGYRVIGYSRRGYYNSAPADRANPGTGSGDLHRLADFLGLSRFHAVASAAGGSVASDYAFSHPDRLLSLTVSSNQFGVAAGEIFAAGARIRPRIWDEIPVEYRELGPSYRAANPDGFRQWVDLNRKSGFADAVRQPLANRIDDARLGQLKVPALVICGAADLATPPSIARMIAARIPGSELAIAPEAGHSVYWEEPEFFNRTVLAFIGKHHA